MGARDTHGRAAYHFDGAATTFAELWQAVNGGAAQLLAAGLAARGAIVYP
jgi:hypothetical protein